MNNGIIETLVEFAQEKAKGAEFEYLELDGWDEFYTGTGIDLLEGRIARGAIRVKPATITLYEYIHGSADQFISWGAVTDSGLKFTGRSIVSAPITEGG